MKNGIENLDPQHFIIIKGAKLHNLKNVDVAIPRNKLVVVTGVSGSGKSSLTIDTLYAEGQRRYVESLSSYARQFLQRMNKPEVDYIKGISPAIAIEQRVSARTSRSTVGTLTEIYDYLRLLFGRVGKTYSPVSGKQVKKHRISDVVDYILELEEGTKLQLLIPFKQHDDRTLQQELDLLIQKGFTRLLVDKKLERIEDLKVSKVKNPDKLLILVDRLVVKKNDEDVYNRTSDSVQTAFVEGEGDCIIDIIGGKRKTFNNRFELDDIIFEEPSDAFFNFNNPFGACKKCEGFGSVIGVDENKVIPNRNLSIYDDAVACWKGEKMNEWKNQLIKTAHHFDFPIHRPIKDLSPEQYQLLWNGNGYFDGIWAFFNYLESKKYKIHYRILSSKYRGRTTCPDCGGTRVRKDAQYVKIAKKSIKDVVLMPISEAIYFFKKIKLNPHDTKIAKRIFTEINNRLGFMNDVGLGYLTLNRLSNTLSGGESQRIQLTRSLGSNLTSSMYILDEPSIGLHPRDSEKLIKVLKHLRDLGNTVIVVEHEEDIIKSADYIIDMGPRAGRLGGEIIFEGNAKEIIQSKTSLTGEYLTEKRKIDLPDLRRKIINKLTIKGAHLHNLKEVNATFPLNAMTVVTGVSGSGKTTLVKDVLYPALYNHLNEIETNSTNFEAFSGDLLAIQQVEMIDQNPIGKSSRSNPVTYIKAWDSIRKLFSSHKLSKVRGYQPKHFSFNVEGGRCETCQGEGEVVVEMQFLADVHLLCDDCKGKRFKPDVLEIQVGGKNVYEILDLTVDEAMDFFEKEPKILKQIKPLQDVGLGYIKLGQPSNTLSGGEAQRVKLASFLTKGRSGNNIFFIFDEPTTGLHFHDIHKLLAAFNALVENGHTVLIIEHNMDVIKCADWVIDLGPDGGDGGGFLLYEGVPEGLPKVKKSYTGRFLKDKI